MKSLKWLIPALMVGGFFVGTSAAMAADALPNTDAPIAHTHVKGSGKFGKGLGKGKHHHHHHHHHKGGTGAPKA